MGRLHHSREYTFYSRVAAMHPVFRIVLKAQLRILRDPLFFFKHTNATKF